MAELDTTAMIHLYRGELGRMVTYRVRLDTTTNWALGSTVAVISFALGQPEVTHAVMLLPYVLGLVFLGVEGRRYQDLEMCRHRIRLMERGFFAPQLGAEPLEGWQESLALSLSSPLPAVTLVQAVSLRLRRNYVWLFLTLYGSWWLDLHLTDAPLLEAAAVGGVGGQTVIILSVLLMVPLVTLAFGPTVERRG